MKKSLQSPTLQEIIDLIGEIEANKLISQIGGLTYYFPIDGAKKRHVSISPVAWQAMCQYFGGFVYIPKGWLEDLAERDNQIREERREGADIIDLAIKFKLSDRRIKSICSGVRAQKPNHHLDGDFKQ